MTALALTPAPAPVKTYGRLDWGHDAERGLSMYRVKAVPHVAQQVKRVFPRADQRTPGVILLHDTPGVARDLEWFMLRWQLDITPATLAHVTGEADRHRATEETVLRILDGYLPPNSWRQTVLPARDYQLAADAIHHATGRLLLADDLGLGKTLSAALRFRDPEALPALVVAPVHLCTQWERELAKFLPWLRCHIIRKGQPYDPAKLRGADPRQPDVLIISYPKLAGWADAKAPRCGMGSEAPQFAMLPTGARISGFRNYQLTYIHEHYTCKSSAQGPGDVLPAGCESRRASLRATWWKQLFNAAILSLLRRS